jgi:hypothetical protein
MIEGHDYTIYSSGPAGRARMYGLLALITAFVTPLSQHTGLALLRRYGGPDWDIAEIALSFGGFTALILFGLLVNLFNAYLWRTRIGEWMFYSAGLTAPPDLNGEYVGSIELQSATDPARVFRTGYFMRISQTWEQLSLLIERASEYGEQVRVHSDMASIRLGMLSGVNTLRFVYTFEESLSRREGIGTMARQFSGAATFEFVREGAAWRVSGHFFDDIGRSGQVILHQQMVGGRNKVGLTPHAPQAPAVPPPPGPDGAPDPNSTLAEMARPAPPPPEPGAAPQPASRESVRDSEQRVFGKDKK